MSDESPCPSGPRLASFHLGRLGLVETEDLAAHVERCERCAATLGVLTESDALVETIAASRGAEPEPAGALIEGLIDRLVELMPALPVSSAGTPDTEAVRSLLHPPLQPDELGRIGPYSILRVLGSGGMGVVFLAEDATLGRKVAVKVIRPELAGRPSARRRFLAEARAAAAVAHDHLIDVYHVGEDRGVAYLVMPLLAGESLDARLERVGRLPDADVVRIGREIAAGLAAAHAHGLIHRDIKPSNVWLEARHTGTAAAERVRILDFGLVRFGADGESGSGSTPGTPGYMAPEQVRGEPLDGRCDLFALGCVLYRMATGRMSFAGPHALAVLRALELEQPEPPDGVNADLSALILRLLAKTADDRPRSAQAVVEALAAIERDLPVHPPSPTKRRSRFGFAPAAGLVAIGVLVVRGSLPLQHAGTDEPEVVAAPLAVPQVKAKVWPIDSLRRESIPADVLAIAGHGDLAAAPPELVAVLGDGRLRHWDVVHSLAANPDGTLLASGGYDRTVKLWNPATGQLLRTLFGHDSKVTTVAFGGEGRVLASADHGGTIKLWDPATGLDRGTIVTNHQRQLNWMALSDDGLTAASASYDGTMKLWNIATGQERFTISAEQGDLHRNAFSRDGRFLASVGQLGTLKVWDAATGNLLRTLTVAKGQWSISVAFSPDGKHLAAGAFDGTIRVWETTDWTLRPGSPRHSGLVNGLAFRADGRVFASAGDDERVRVWDTATGAELKNLFGHEWKVATVAFLGDGPLLASGGWDHTIRLWDTDTGEERVLADGHRGQAFCLAFRPDGRHLVSGGGPVVKVWDLSSGTEAASLRVPRGGAVWTVAFHPNGNLFVTGSLDSDLNLWEMGTWSRRTIPTGFQVADVLFTRNGHGVVTARGLGGEGIDVWDAGTGKHITTFFGHRANLSRLALSPDGTVLASTSPDKTVKLWNATTGFELHTLTGHTQDTSDLAFRSDGRILASGSDDRTIKLWDPVQFKELRTLTGHTGGVNSVAFPPASNTLASAGNDGTVRLWDSDTGTPGRVIRLAPPGGKAYWVAFSPDGRHLAVANGNGTVYILRLAPPPAAP